MILSLLILTFAFGCRYTTGQVLGPTANTTDYDSSVSASQPITMPIDSLDMAYRNVAVKSVRMFYKSRQERLMWNSDLKRSAADSLIAFIENIRYFGLRANDYNLAEINVLKDKLNSVENIRRLEALLTDAYLAMSRHIRFGKLMQSTEQMDSLSISSLERYTQGGGVAHNLTVGEPSFSGYRSLKQGLEHLIDSLSQDQRSAVLSNSPLVPDNIRRNVQTIEVNLERWRSERRSFGSRYIFINIPAFMLYLVENDAVILESKVIVGTPETPTPELSSTIDCFITYPYWHVPRKIAVEEYLPLIQQDTSFISRNNFDVLDRRGNLLNADSVEWTKFSQNYFPVSLRQREGAENALGVIKFVFDNPYAVFLHDTNAKRLFKSKVRAFSHGCIRMEKAVDLSHYLVTGSLNKKSKNVETFLKEETRHCVELRKPIPIFVRYFTCEFDNGRVKYYQDIYRKDSSITDRLYMSIGPAGL